MKRLISTLFAVAAISAAVVPQVHAETVKTWIMVAVLLDNGEPFNGKFFNGITSEKDCEAKRVQLAQEAKAARIEVWSQCLEVTGDKVPGDPKTKQKS